MKKQISGCVRRSVRGLFLVVFLLSTVVVPAQEAERLEDCEREGRYSEWMVRSEMLRTPRSFLLDFSKRPKWSYVMGIELEAMLDTYLRYGGDDILGYCREYVDTMIDVKGQIRGYDLREYNLDNVRTGHFLARMQQLCPQDRLSAALQTLMQQLDSQPRTVADSVFWHKAIYAYQVWLDGIFMGLPFRVLATSQSDVPSSVRKAVYDDAVSQISITYRRTLDPLTGLNRHAYDENRNMFWPILLRAFRSIVGDGRKAGLLWPLWNCWMPFPTTIPAGRCCYPCSAATSMLYCAGRMRRAVCGIR